MGGTENAIHLVSAAGIEAWPRLAKDDVARKLARRIAEALV
jgi:phosphopantothenoylcysteine decarboxylase / phosphopantothenate---cysteine ligase